ncbi:MAG: MBL fold metallo-hydrolase, partial [Ottowia sp.]|nr:MBL fold metallo-hydrolase [Ottowia sp.]
MSLAAELERALHYPLGDQLPPPGRATELRPGVKWLRMQLPFALDHINLWLLRDRFQGREGWTVVDTCIDRAESRADWEKVFEAELEGLPIVRVLVTHMHPDHVGLAHWLCERWNAPLWMSGTDYQTARYACQVVNSFGGERLADYFFSHGMTDPADLEQIRNRKSYYRGLVPALPPSYARLMDGATVTIGGLAWRCIAGYG